MQSTHRVSVSRAARGAAPSAHKGRDGGRHCRVPQRTRDDGGWGPAPHFRPTWCLQPLKTRKQRWPAQQHRELPRDDDDDSCVGGDCALLMIHCCHLSPRTRWPRRTRGPGDTAPCPLRIPFSPSSGTVHTFGLAGVKHIVRSGSEVTQSAEPRGAVQSSEEIRAQLA